jgi:Family of unknown function (DUF5313)
MSSDKGSRRRPNVLQYVAYCYGRVLSASMQDWVRRDLGGKGATVRTMIRWAIPCVVVLAPFWLIPTTFVVHLSMTVPIFAPYVMFSHALDKVWRRHRLSQHGLNPDLADEYKRSRDAHIHRAYTDRYGPRPQLRSHEPIPNDIGCAGLEPGADPRRSRTESQ